MPRFYRLMPQSDILKPRFRVAAWNARVDVNALFNRHRTGIGLSPPRSTIPLVVGDKELLRAMRRLPSKVRSNVENKALRRVSKPMIAAVRAAAPVRSGQLRKSIGRVIRTYRRSGTKVAVIGPRHGFSKEWKGRTIDPAKYGHLPETGAQAHLIYNAFGRGTIRHPGFPARPYIEPVISAIESHYPALVGAELWAGIRKHLRR